MFSLRGLPSLRQLHLANNQLRTLPFTIVDMPLQGLTVSNNPLRFPPMAVCRRGLKQIKAHMEEAYSAKLEEPVGDNPYYDSDSD